MRIAYSLIVFLALGLSQAAAQSPTRGDGWQRLDLRFPCGQDVCAGWLYVPVGAHAQVPAVVMGHGFAGTRDAGLATFAERFAQAGIAAFAFDYRHFGASGGAPRQLVDPRLQVADFASALPYVRKRPEVDGKRVALWGTSMGAGNALIAAADDGHAAALVLQAPLIDTTMQGDATHLGAWWAMRLVVSGWEDMASRAFGGGAVTIAAIAPKGGFGMIVDDSAYRAFQKLVGPHSTYRNGVVASSAFNFKHYNPATREGDLHLPVLVVASTSDRFAPFAAAQALIGRVKGATLQTFDGDHFDIYSPPAAGMVAEKEAAFLARVLKARND